MNRPDILIEKNLITKEEIESLRDDKVCTIIESSYPEIYQKLSVTLLKVSKFRKQIMVPKLLPKTNQAHYPGSLLLQG